MRRSISSRGSASGSSGPQFDAASGLNVDGVSDGPRSSVPISALLAHAMLLHPRPQRTRVDAEKRRGAARAVNPPSRQVERATNLLLLMLVQRCDALIGYGYGLRQ